MVYCAAFNNGLIIQWFAKTYYNNVPTGSHEYTKTLPIAFKTKFLSAIVGNGVRYTYFVTWLAHSLSTFTFGTYNPTNNVAEHFIMSAVIFGY